jgi:polyisoprenoid-binding protein YceI
LVAALALTLSAGVASVAFSQGMPGFSKDPAAAPAGAYALDPNHTSVIARATHLGLSHFGVRFDSVEGTYTYDPAHPLATKVSVAIDATSLDVGRQMLNPSMTLNDHFIKERDLAGGSKTAKITFVSTSIQGSNGHGTMTGDLTLNGVTKPVTFDVTFNGTLPGMGGGGQRMGFTADSTIKRSDFGILAKMPATVISDDVSLHIETEFAKTAG